MVETCLCQFSTFSHSIGFFFFFGLHTRSFFFWKDEKFINQTEGRQKSVKAEN